MVAHHQELPITSCSDSDSDVDEVAAGSGHRWGCRRWAAMFTLPAVLGVALLVASGAGRHGGPAIAKVADVISESHYSQTRSYKCNKNHSETLKICGSFVADAENTTMANATAAKCRILANAEYHVCCAEMPNQRCSFPCSEACQQKHGTITAEGKKCCKRCPGGECVDPWRLLDEFWYMYDGDDHGDGDEQHRMDA